MKFSRELLGIVISAETSCGWKIMAMVQPMSRLELGKLTM